MISNSMEKKRSTNKYKTIPLTTSFGDMNLLIVRVIKQFWGRPPPNLLLRFFLNKYTASNSGFFRIFVSRGLYIYILVVFFVKSNILLLSFD